LQSDGMALSGHAAVVPDVEAVPLRAESEKLSLKQQRRKRVVLKLIAWSSRAVARAQKIVKRKQTKEAALDPTLVKSGLEELGLAHLYVVRTDALDEDGCTVWERRDFIGAKSNPMHFAWSHSSEIGRAASEFPPRSESLHSTFLHDAVSLSSSSTVSDQGIDIDADADANADTGDSAGSIIRPARPAKAVVYTRRTTISTDRLSKLKAKMAELRAKTAALAAGAPFAGGNNHAAAPPTAAAAAAATRGAASDGGDGGGDGFESERESVLPLLLREGSAGRSDGGHEPEFRLEVVLEDDSSSLAGSGGGVCTDADGSAICELDFINQDIDEEDSGGVGRSRSVGRGNDDDAEDGYLSDLEPTGMTVPYTPTLQALLSFQLVAAVAATTTSTSSSKEEEKPKEVGDRSHNKNAAASGPIGGKQAAAVTATVAAAASKPMWYTLSSFGSVTTPTISAQKMQTMAMPLFPVAVDRNVSDTSDVQHYHHHAGASDAGAMRRDSLFIEEDELAALFGQ